MTDCSDRNEEYYLEDIVFRVEGQLFKVHRHLFVKLSPVFRDMFNLPVPDGAQADGLTDNQPLVLEGIKKKDFVPLLRCLYPLNFSVNSDTWFSLEHWQSVLKLASLYEMAEVKALAMEKMEPLLTERPSLQVHLAKTYGIRKWLAPGLFALAQRVKPLDQGDVDLVGLSDSLKICALREKLRRCGKCSRCSAGTHTGSDIPLDTLISLEFGAFGSEFASLVKVWEQNFCNCPKPSKPVTATDILRKPAPPPPEHQNLFFTFGPQSDPFPSTTHFPIS